MPNAHSLSLCVSNASSPSRCTSRRAVLSLRLWRGFWLVAGLIYATAHICALLEMSHVVFGAAMPPQQMLDEANDSVTRFPFDPYLMGLRHFVRVRLHQMQDAADAARQ
jgi:hypothetical protein